MGIRYESVGCGQKKVTCEAYHQFFFCFCFFLLCVYMLLSCGLCGIQHRSLKSREILSRTLVKNGAAPPAEDSTELREYKENYERLKVLKS